MRSAVTAGSAYVRAPLPVPSKSPGRMQNIVRERQQKYIPAGPRPYAMLRLRMELSPSHVTSHESWQMWKLVLAYDGTDFHGWQVQPGLITIQGELAAAIERVCGERTLPQGSGRTDAGVHALAQVASIALQSRIPPPNLHRALNRTLPASIRVLEAAHAPHGFHARHSAISKQYEYRIYRGEICPPHLARYVFAMPQPLDLAGMQQAAALVVGTHDFSSFAASDPDRASRMAANPEIDNIRTLTHSGWHEDGDLLIYTVRGNGFLHHMVRNLAGTFLEVGRGRRNAADLPELLACCNRMAAGATAPARGLFLHSVIYPESGATLG
jgi:tRNA pseudouridine38-40 synthase